MPEAVRVLHLLFPSDVGGLETVVPILAAGQARRGMSVMVALLVEREGQEQSWHAGLGDRGVEVRGIPVRGRRYLAERKAVEDVIRDWRPSVLHTHGYRPDVVDAPVGRRLGIPIVTTVHGFTGGGFKNRLYEWLQTREFRRFDAVVAVSGKLVSDLKQAGVPEERIHRIPNAWAPPASFLSRPEARALLGLDAQESVVGWIGRLTPEKAPCLMVKAFSRLRESSAVLVMGGEGSMKTMLQALARDLGVDDRVHWPGIVPEAYRVLRAFDVVVLSSRTEGTPMVLLEAMAAGVPIVSRAVGGVPEMLSPNEASLVNEEDEAALARSIDEALSDPKTARARAALARQRFDREFCVEPWVERYLEVYRGLLT